MQSTPWKYRHDNTNVNLVNYHIIFCPKYHRSIMVGVVSKRLEYLFKQIIKANGWRMLAQEVMPNHVHLFVQADTKTSPSAIVKRLKGTTSRILRQDFPGFQQKKAFWSPSYFCATAGNVSSTGIQKYIENQWGNWKK